MTCQNAGCRKPARRKFCSERCLRRAAYLRHHEARLAKQAAYRAANPEKVAATRDAWAARNRERLLAEARLERARRRAEAAIARPRCMICSARLPWDDSHFPLRGTTCGGECARKRWVWFGAQKPRRKGGLGDRPPGDGAERGDAVGARRI